MNFGSVDSQYFISCISYPFYYFTVLFASYCISFLSCHCGSVSDHPVLLLLINLIWFDLISATRKQWTRGLQLRVVGIAAWPWIAMFAAPQTAMARPRPLPLFSFVSYCCYCFTRITQCDFSSANLGAGSVRRWMKTKDIRKHTGWLKIKYPTRQYMYAISSQPVVRFKILEVWLHN